MDELEFTLYKVSRKEVVLQQDTRCNHLYVLLKGELEVNIIDVAGNLVKVEEIIAPRAFATPHLFGENNILPATFTVSKDSILLMATRTSVFKLISSVPQLLHSFLCVTGNCNKCSVSLRFHLMIAPGITKANDELLLTPILIDIKGNHSFAFPVIRVNGKIREKIVRRQKVLHSSKAEKDLIYTVSNRQWNTITCSTPMLANQLWIWQAKLVLRRQLGNCCMKKELDMVELFTWSRTDGYSIVKPEIKNKVEIPEMLPHKCATEVLAETEKFVEPIDNYSAGKRILAGEQEGAQIVYFKLAKAEIDSNYLDNERVLEHIIDVIRRISEDPEVEIARVVLLGLSSPEGAFEFNKRLSGKRAEALKQYIADRIALADSCFALVNGDEGWEELRYKVEHSGMEYRKEVLNIIDSVPIMKGREGQLQRLKRGVPYRYLEEHFFPQLRRAGYIKVYYRMKNGTI